jgi:hypothetical protein
MSGSKKTTRYNDDDIICVYDSSGSKDQKHPFLNLTYTQEDESIIVCDSDDDNTIFHTQVGLTGMHGKMLFT